MSSDSSKDELKPGALILAVAASKSDVWRGGQLAHEDLYTLGVLSASGEGFTSSYSAHLSAAPPHWPSAPCLTGWKDSGSLQEPTSLLSQGNQLLHELSKEGSLSLDLSY